MKVRASDEVQLSIHPEQAVGGVVDSNAIGPLDVGGNNRFTPGTVQTSFLDPRRLSPVTPVEESTDTQLKYYINVSIQEVCKENTRKNCQSGTTLYNIVMKMLRLQ